MLRWLSFPPVVSVLLLFPVMLLRNPSASVSIPVTLWGAAISAYLCVCMISIFFISQRGDNSHNATLGCLAQGLLLLVVSLHAGSLFMSFLGVLLFLAGLFLTFTSATNDAPGPAARAPGVSSELSRVNAVSTLVSKLELPICITDAGGLILEPSAKFCEVVGASHDDLTGEAITDILPIDDETATFQSGKWWLSQVKDGANFYFSLLPTPHCAPQQQEVQAPQQRGMGIIDKDTELYVEEYRQLRGPQEIARSQRYKRPLSGILVALQLTPSPNLSISEEQNRMVFIAFATKVAQSLRNTDCGFLLPNGSIQLLLPETPGANAKTVMSRLVTLPQDAFDEGIRTALNPKVHVGMTFYNGASKMEYSLFSAALEESLQRFAEEHRR